MRTALAVDCPAHEPHPVLLEQLTQLAAASVAPAAKPWWHRLSTKTGAAVVVGALMISGATADAQRALRTTPPQSVAAAIPLTLHKAARSSSPAVFVAPRWARHSAALKGRAKASSAHSKNRHAKLNRQRGKANSHSESIETSVPLAPTAVPQASLLASSTLPSGPHAHAHPQQRAKSHH